MPGEAEAPALQHAVLGIGYAGLVDVSTLLAARSPIVAGGVLWLGDDDPWSAYDDHAMGQWPCLLALPGYRAENQPRNEEAAQWLSSRAFAENNARQLEAIERELRVARLPGQVRTPFRLEAGELVIEVERADSTVQTVRLRSLDVCTGPGPARLLDRDRPQGPFVRVDQLHFDDELYDEYRRGGVSARVQVAQRFMHADVTPGARVLVVGEGALAAGCAERALARGSRVVWVGRRDDLAQNLPDSGRYEHLFRDPRWRQTRSFEAAPPGLTVLVARVRSLVPSGGRVRVELAAESRSAALAGPAVVDDIDQVVISASSRSGANEEGSMRFLMKAWMVPRGERKHRLDPIVSDGLVVGYSALGGLLRVLGAPMSGLAAEEPPGVVQELRRWLGSLPRQARLAGIQIGITAGAALIARANGFYRAVDAPDECAHTATAADLRRVGCADFLERRCDPAEPCLHDIPAPLQSYPRASNP